MKHHRQITSEMTSMVAICSSAEALRVRLV